MNRNGSAAIDLAKKLGQVAITDHGETVAFILSAKRVEGLLETLDVMSDPDAMKAIRLHAAGRLKMKDAGCLDD